MNEGIQILFGIGLFILIALLTFLVVLVVRALSKLSSVYQGVDHALVGFGQSGVGRLTNQAVNQASTYFDQPTDAAIIRITQLIASLTFLMQLTKAAGIDVTPERVSAWGRAIFDALNKLTDGVPAENLQPQKPGEEAVR